MLEHMSGNTKKTKLVLELYLFVIHLVAIIPLKIYTLIFGLVHLVAAVLGCCRNCMKLGSEEQGWEAVRPL
jgi:hypothetical protein